MEGFKKKSVAIVAAVTGSKLRHFQASLASAAASRTATFFPDVLHVGSDKTTLPQILRVIQQAKYEVKSGEIITII